MRAPREDVLQQSERLRLVALDVTKPQSIAAALEAAGPIDVLVNNAGIGALGVFEATAIGTAREMFEINTFGAMAMTQAVLPQFRERRSGVIVNVTSSAALARMPLVAVYTASKADRRGLHRIAGARARGLQRQHQACRARLRPDDQLHQQCADA